MTTASGIKIKKTIKKITANWRTMNLEDQEGKQQKISDVAEPKIISPQMILVLLLTINREWKGEDKKKGISNVKQQSNCVVQHKRTIV